MLGLVSQCRVLTDYVHSAVCMSVANKELIWDISSASYWTLVNFNLQRSIDHEASANWIRVVTTCQLVGHVELM